MPRSTCDAYLYHCHSAIFSTNTHTHFQFFSIYRLCLPVSLTMSFPPTQIELQPEKGQFDGHIEQQPDELDQIRQQQLANLTDREDHQDGKWQAIKKNPWAFAWCLFAVWTVLLVSFENQASGNILGIPQFRKDFGSLYEGNYVLSAKWQSAFSGAPVAS
jgi:SP family general alpha glucoside:H+ symporter-like MFS transporter